MLITYTLSKYFFKNTICHIKRQLASCKIFGLHAVCAPPAPENLKYFHNIRNQDGIHIAFQYAAD